MASLKVEITGDFKILKRMADPKTVAIAERQTINRVTDSMRVVVTKSINARYHIPRGKLSVKKNKEGGVSNRTGLRVVKASRNGDSASLIAKGGRLPLYAFKASPNKPWRKGQKVKSRKPIRVKVKKNGSPRVIKKGFIATLQNTKRDGSKGSSHTGVFYRVKGTPRKMGEVFGPAIADMFQDDTTLRAATKSLQDNSAKVFEHNLRRQLGLNAGKNLTKGL